MTDPSQPGAAGTLPVTIGVASVQGGRSNNEDSYLAADPTDGRLLAARGRLVVVADGMGGAAGGETASKLVVETIRDAYYAPSDGEIPRVLGRALERANAAVHSHAQSRPDLTGMGSTCVAVAIHQGRAWVAHVGDSRAYLMRAGQLYPLTQDHTRVNQMVRDGFLTEDQARVHPEKHVLNRSMGPRPNVEVEVCPEAAPLMDGDRLLLCSDGLTDSVHESEIAWFLDHFEPQEAAEAICEFVMERHRNLVSAGERQERDQDNTTVEVVLIGRFPKAAHASPRPSAIPGGAPATVIGPLPPGASRLRGRRGLSRTTLVVAASGMVAVVALAVVLIMSWRSGTEPASPANASAPSGRGGGGDADAGRVADAAGSGGDVGSRSPDEAESTAAAERDACFARVCPVALGAMTERLRALGYTELEKLAVIRAFESRPKDQTLREELEGTLREYQRSTHLRESRCPDERTLRMLDVSVARLCHHRDELGADPTDRQIERRSGTSFADLPTSLQCLPKLYERSDVCRESLRRIFLGAFDNLEGEDGSGEAVLKILRDCQTRGWGHPDSQEELERLMAIIRKLQRLKGVAPVDGCPGSATAEKAGTRWDCPKAGSTAFAADGRAPANSDRMTVSVPAGQYRMGQSELPDAPEHEVRLSAFRIDQQMQAGDSTWAEARDICAKRGMRLPTEAEWEVAARQRFFEPGERVDEWVEDWYAKDAYGDGGVRRDPRGPAMTACDDNPTKRGCEKVVRGGDPAAIESSRDHRPPDQHREARGFRCVLDSGAR